MDKQILLEERRLHNLIFRRLQRMSGSRGGRGYRLQGMIIAYLCERPDERICQKDLEAEFFVRGSTMAEALNQLEAAGYIERRTSDDDRRLKIVRPTLKATEAYAGMEDHIRTMEESLTRGVDPRDLAVYFEVVDKICNNLEAE
ncbi:MAG TPA: MarR family transcriptional regulator [Firmicutes bacterium]|nr:MarR family transcriptional regulator [Bacillota bacterium]